MKGDDRGSDDAATGQEIRILCVGGHFFPWSRVKKTIGASNGVAESNQAFRPAQPFVRSVPKPARVCEHGHINHQINVYSFGAGPKPANSTRSRRT
jgi:hypothetical protein